MVPGGMAGVMELVDISDLETPCLEMKNFSSRREKGVLEQWIRDVL
jgi:hypothetical protein